MTEVSEIIPSLNVRTHHSHRDHVIVALAEALFIRLATRTGNPLNSAHALEDAAASLQAARAFYDAVDEWTAERAAAAAAEADDGGYCDARR